MVVPQSGHLAFIAGLPFFIVTFWGLSTSFLPRHLTQYIVAIFLTHLLSFVKKIFSGQFRLRSGGHRNFGG
jgi:hypothetical protein